MMVTLIRFWGFSSPQHLHKIGLEDKIDLTLDVLTVLLNGNLVPSTYVPLVSSGVITTFEPKDVHTILYDIWEHTYKASLAGGQVPELPVNKKVHLATLKKVLAENISKVGPLYTSLVPE
jgi:hypothetical protein